MRCRCGNELERVPPHLRELAAWVCQQCAYGEPKRVAQDKQKKRRHHKPQPDPMRCIKCEQEKPLREGFTIVNQDTGRRHTTCRVCRSNRATELERIRKNAKA
jgi:hypothetical protein